MYRLTVFISLFLTWFFQPECAYSIRSVPKDWMAEQLAPEGQIAFEEYKRVVGWDACLTPGKMWPPTAIAREIETQFFPGHAFFEFTGFFSREEHIIAVNRKTMVPALVYGRPYVFSASERKFMDIDSRTEIGSLLNIGSLNEVIAEEGLTINDVNLKSFIRDFFNIARIQFVFLDMETLAKESRGKFPDANAPRDSWGFLQDFLLSKSEGLTVVEKTSDNYRVNVLSVVWSFNSRYVSEWDMSVNVNGSITVYDVRDIELCIGPGACEFLYWAEQ